MGLSDMPTGRDPSLPRLEVERPWTPPGCKLCRARSQTQTLLAPCVFKRARSGDPVDCHASTCLNLNPNRGGGVLPKAPSWIRRAVEAQIGPGT